MKEKILFGLLLLPLLLFGDTKTYNQQIVINLWNKDLKEITKIKRAFEEVARKYELEIQIQNIPESDIKWKEMLDAQKEEKNK